MNKNYMDEREGACLQHVAPEYFSEVYNRVRRNARLKYINLQNTVEKYKKLNMGYKMRKQSTVISYKIDYDYAKELSIAEEHLERFINANADYLI